MSDHAKRKRGGNRRADALCERDAVAIARLMHTKFMTAKEAGEELGIPARRAQRLARKGLSNTWLYTPEHIENLTEMHTSIVTGRGDFDLSLPEPVQTAPVPQGESVIAALATPVVTPPVEPAPKAESVHEEEPWPWSDLMSREEFLTRDPWRQKQLIEQWTENIVLGGKHAVTLRGGSKNRNCFRGCPSYECTCEENP